DGGSGCPCGAMGAVATPTDEPRLIACATAGTRYASDLPVPVPACTARCSPDPIACPTAPAIASCPDRPAPPLPAPDAASRAANEGSDGPSSPDGASRGGLRVSPGGTSGNATAPP